MSRIILLILSFAVTSLAAYGGWAYYGRPQAMQDVPDGKLRCVSYAPYRVGQSPFIEGLVIPPAQIEEDIENLSKQFDCLRTYSVNQGLAEVPRIAAKYGMKVLLGVWIGRDSLNKATNEKEIETAVRLANDPANRDTLMAIVVGNEVLLRREFNAKQMADWIGMVKKQVIVPVTYADVWEFWLKNPSLAESVDYLTVHILPYWEDDPVSLDHAMAHLHKVLDKLRGAFPGRKLFIGETGWPSAGRTREGAVPSRVNEARYIREFIHTIGEEQVDYNVIESIDQPWKKIQEGTVGGYWGIYTVEREQKFPFAGPVSEDSQWRRNATIGMTIAAVLLVALLTSGAPLGLFGWLAAAAAAQTSGALLVWQLRFLEETSLNEGTWLVNFSGIVLSASAALLLLLTVTDVATRRAGATPAPIAQTLAWLRSPRFKHLDRTMALGLLQCLTLFGAAAISWQMLFDPRYRDFPIPTYLIPAVGFAVLYWLRNHRPVAALETQPDYREECWLAYLIAGASLINVLREGYLNGESLLWTGTVVLIVWPWLQRVWRARQAARGISRAGA